MPYTPYSKANAEFSNAAHIAAQHKIYPLLFKLPFENLLFESTLLETSKRAEVLDGEMAIDRIVRVKPKSELQHIGFTVQERFRKRQYAQYKDITITEWNNNTNLPSELYKLNANMFLYGYFFYVPNTKVNIFIDAIVIDVTKMLLCISNNSLVYKRRINPRSNQSFITITFAQLEKENCVLFRLK